MTFNEAWLENPYEKDGRFFEVNNRKDDKNKLEFETYDICNSLHIKTLFYSKYDVEIYRSYKPKTSSSRKLLRSDISFSPRLQGLTSCFASRTCVSVYLGFA